MTELETPPAPDAIAAPTTPAAPITPPAAPAPEPEPDAVDIGGQQMVPLAALHAVRAELKPLKEQAAQLAEVKQWYTQAKPYVDFLQAHPDLLTKQTTQPVSPVAAPVLNPAHLEIAKMMDLYTPEGQPDVARAGQIATFIETIAEQKADAKVKPLTEQTAKSKSEQNFQRALATATPDGRKVKADVLREIWANVPSEMTADERTASLLVYSALGYEVMHTPHTPGQQTPLAPPVSEPPGGRLTPAASLTPLDERIANLRSITPQRYAENVTGFVKGRPSVLED